MTEQSIPLSPAKLVKLLRAVSRFRTADVEFRRAHNDDNDDGTRLNRAGTAYGIAKIRLFDAADEANSLIPKVTP
jgi:hypothetical protein